MRVGCQVDRFGWRRSAHGDGGSRGVCSPCGSAARAIAGLGFRPDIVLECTGVIDLVQQSVACASPGGIVCLTGVGPADATGDPVAALATQAVLGNPEDIKVIVQMSSA